MADWWTIIIAAYAAIVSTVALALEVRRWFESGPRLCVSIMPEAIALNVPEAEGNSYLMAAVTNRGTGPTTLTTFGLRHYANWLDRVRSKPAWSGIVVNPQLPGLDPIIPTVLQPGEIWHGWVLLDELKGRAEKGLLYVSIFASHSDKPVLKRVHKPAKPPEGAEKVGN